MDNNKELKEKIASAYQAATPDMLDDILKECASIEQEEVPYDTLPNKKKSWVKYAALAASFAVVLVLGFSVGRLTGRQDETNQEVAAVETTTEEVVVEDTASEPEEPADLATIYFDVNTTFTIIIDENKMVKSCTADDAEIQALIDEMGIEGASLDTAVNAIVGTLYLNGYMDQPGEAPTDQTQEQAPTEEAAQPAEEAEGTPDAQTPQDGTTAPAATDDAANVTVETEDDQTRQDLTNELHNILNRLGLRPIFSYNIDVPQETQVYQEAAPAEEAAPETNQEVQVEVPPQMNDVYTPSENTTSQETYDNSYEEPAAEESQDYWSYDYSYDWHNYFNNWWGSFWGY